MNDFKERLDGPELKEGLLNLLRPEWTTGYDLLRAYERSAEAATTEAATTEAATTDAVRTALHELEYSSLISVKRIRGNYFLSWSYRKTVEPTADPVRPPSLMDRIAKLEETVKVLEAALHANGIYL